MPRRSEPVRITVEATEPEALLFKPSEVFVRKVNERGVSGFPDVELLAFDRVVLYDFIAENWGTDYAEEIRHELGLP